MLRLQTRVIWRSIAVVEGFLILQMGILLYWISDICIGHSTKRWGWRRLLAVGWLSSRCRLSRLLFRRSITFNLLLFILLAYLRHFVWWEGARRRVCGSHDIGIRVTLNGFVCLTFIWLFTFPIIFRFVVYSVPFIRVIATIRLARQIFVTLQVKSYLCRFSSPDPRVFRLPPKVTLGWRILSRFNLRFLSLNLGRMQLWFRPAHAAWLHWEG